MNVSTITSLFKVTSGYMFRLDLVILRPILIFVLPDTVYTLGSHRVYIRKISGYMFRLVLVILRPILTSVLPDTVHTLGSHRVYIRGIHLVKTFFRKCVKCDCMIEYVKLSLKMYFADCV